MTSANDTGSFLHPFWPRHARVEGLWRAGILVAACLAVALILVAPPAAAQDCDPDFSDCPPSPPPPPSGYSPETSDTRSREVPELEQRERSFVNPRATEAFVADIGRASETCDRITQNYRLHCLVRELDRVAATVPEGGEYAPVRAALEQATRGLQAITDTYEDTAAPRVRARVGGRPAAPRTQPITAIRPETVARAAAEAEAVLDEAVTILLRSAENSARRQVAFQPIAQAIDSTKVLLRST